MASCCNESSADPASDLATIISKGKVNKKVLQLFAKKDLLDIPDKDGRTPLMIACLKGLEDAVKFLLANGANPNSKCLKEGNTPLHYACSIEGRDGKDAFFSSYYNPSRRMPSKIAIITLLLSSGAEADQENLDGWTPPCLAALYVLTDVVDIFLKRDGANIPLELQIKITEILGVSQAICTLDGDFEFDDVFSSFSQAICLRNSAALPKAQLEISVLMDCFMKAFLKECHTTEEIKIIKESTLGLKAHAFLVGDRLFPKKLKQKYLYPALAGFGCDLMWELKMFIEGFNILSCVIGFEHRGESQLGSVVDNLARTFDTLVCEDEEVIDLYLQYVRDLLCEYESVLNHVHIDSLSDHADCLLERFGCILFDEAFHCSAVDALRSTLQTIERSVRVIKSRILKENPDKYHKLSSVTFKVMDLLAEDFVYVMISGRIPPSRPLLRVKFVIRKTLLFDTSASFRDRNSGDTLLHLVANCACVPKHLDLLEDLALAFIRHGCPVDVVNDAGETAREFLMRDEMYDQDDYPRLLTLVSPPTTVLSLEEITIRQILQKDISYLGEVPTCLYAVIRGGLNDSDLERANDEASDEEEME